MQTQKVWISRAKELLRASLSPIPHELNELDWKSGLSENKEKLSQHLSAFSNQSNGGFFVFGISPMGEAEGIETSEANDIIKKLGNISRDTLDPPQQIDHFIENDFGKNILFIFVRETSHKPVHLRGKGIEFSYLRSGGQTRKMSRQEIANTVLFSKQIRYEELEALTCDVSEILNLLDHAKLFELLGIVATDSAESIIEQLINHKMVYRKNGNFSITNLGAIVGARDLRRFPGKERFSTRVIKYKGTSRIETEMEKEFSKGYAVGFQDLIRSIMGQLPTSEIIKDALRKNVSIYPEITIRELVANALIHRDFSVTGTNPMVEIFSDRIEILNPGVLLPSVRVERIIDTAPESRNEILAALMRRMGICEERGSGIDKAVFHVEVYGLPPIKFINGHDAFKTVLFSPRNFKQMSADERLDACYQHCCLKFVSGQYMTNATFRKRLGLKDNQYAQAWRVIDSAVEKKIIKLRDSTNKSRKYASYIPFWA